MRRRTDIVAWLVTAGVLLAIGTAATFWFASLHVLYDPVCTGASGWSFDRWDCTRIRLGFFASVGALAAGACGAGVSIVLGLGRLAR